ncbi:hypothetical protein EVD20_22150 [Elizabethkingia bruuniana]|nr:hypothetical protein EVD20_22150 [Elizabethkingia bruuniana]
MRSLLARVLKSANNGGYTFYTFISQNTPEEIDTFFRTLPEELRLSISQYQNQKDRQARVLSKFLTEKLFRQFYPDHQLDWKNLKR